MPGRRPVFCDPRAGCAWEADDSREYFRFELTCFFILERYHRAVMLCPTDSHFRTLARTSWRKRKHGYVRRAVRRLQNSAYALLGSSIVANTSGRALSSGNALKSSVSLPT